MALHIVDTNNKSVEIMDDGTTIEEIITALKWLRKERQRSKDRIRPKTGRPRGRPRKENPSGLEN